MTGRGGPNPIRLSTDSSVGVVQAAAQSGRAVLRADLPLSSQVVTAVVAIDFRPTSVDAARLVYRMMRDQGTLYLVHVIPHSESEVFTLDRARDEHTLRRHFEQVIHNLPRDKRSVRVVPVLRCGEIDEQILEFFHSNHAQLLGLGCRHWTNEWEASQGITARILNGSRLPMVVVPPRRRAAYTTTFDGQTSSVLMVPEFYNAVR